MPSPIMARGPLRHFTCGTDPPAVCQTTSSVPVRAPTSFSLRGILVDVAGERGAWGGAGRLRSPQEGVGGMMGEEGYAGDRVGATVDSNTRVGQRREMVTDDIASMGKY